MAVTITDGGARRSSLSFSDDAAAKTHAAFKRARVTLPDRLNLRVLRDAIGEIRRLRNATTDTLNGLSRIVGSLKADLERIERVVEAEKAVRIDTNDGLAGTTNDKHRAARLASILSEDLDAIAAVREDLARATEALSHGKLVLDELRGAFDETSRLQASFELAWKIQHGER